MSSADAHSADGLFLLRLQVEDDHGVEGDLEARSELITEPPCRWLVLRCPATVRVLDFVTHALSITTDVR